LFSKRRSWYFTRDADFRKIPNAISVDNSFKQKTPGISAIHTTRLKPAGWTKNARLKKKAAFVKLKTGESGKGIIHTIHRKG